MCEPSLTACPTGHDQDRGASSLPRQQLQQRSYYAQPSLLQGREGLVEVHPSYLRLENDQVDHYSVRYEDQYFRLDWEALRQTYRLPFVEEALVLPASCIRH